MHRATVRSHASPEAPYHPHSAFPWTHCAALPLSSEWHTHPIAPLQNIARTVLAHACYLYPHSTFGRFARLRPHNSPMERLGVHSLCPPPQRIILHAWVQWICHPTIIGALVRDPPPYSQGLWRCFAERDSRYATLAAAIEHGRGPSYGCTVPVPSTTGAAFRFPPHTHRLCRTCTSLRHKTRGKGATRSDPVSVAFGMVHLQQSLRKNPEIREGKRRKVEKTKEEGDAFYGFGLSQMHRGHAVTLSQA